MYLYVNLLDIFPLFIKHDDLINTEYNAGSSNLSGQVGPEFSGLSIVQDRTGQGHTHCVSPTLEIQITNCITPFITQTDNRPLNYDSYLSYSVVVQV